MASKFTEGKEYLIIKVYRSAVSVTLPRLEGINAGQHRLVCHDMRRIVQKKPPLPRHSSSWDVSKALAHITSLGDNAILSLKQLSEKLVVLLALTSAERGSELAAHDLRFRKYHLEEIDFNLPELTRSVHVGKHLFVHASFPQDKILCPCECLRAYEAHTATLRAIAPGQPNMFF